MWERATEPIREGRPSFGEIVAACSDDGGVTWSPPARLGPTRAAAPDQPMGNVHAAGSGGRRLAVWSAFNASDADGRGYDLLHAVTADGGATWTPGGFLHRGSDDPGGDHLFPKVAYDGADRWLVVWSSSSPGIQGISDALGKDFDIIGLPLHESDARLNPWPGSPEPALGGSLRSVQAPSRRWDSKRVLALALRILAAALSSLIFLWISKFTLEWVHKASGQRKGRPDQ
jgi:hypothetical protein